MPRAGVGPEKDSKARVLEERAGLWGQLVGGALATPVGGPASEGDDRDGAGARGGTSIGCGPQIGAIELFCRGSGRDEAPPGQVDATSQTELGVWVAYALGGGCQYS